jgi:hypothetical protein
MTDELVTPQGEPALTPPPELPGTREPAADASQDSPGESPALIPLKEGSRKRVPDFSGRLYLDDQLCGGLLGTWVRRAEVDVLLDEVTLLRAALNRILSMVVPAGYDSGHSGVEAECRRALSGASPAAEKGEFV